MGLLLNLALGGFFRNVLEDNLRDFDLDELGELFDDVDGIDLFDDLDQADLFDELDDLNLLDGIGDFIDDNFDSTEELADSEFFDDLVGREIIKGTSGDDSLRGTADDDIFSADSGNDTLLGLRGDDILIGGRGDDQLYGQLGNDILSGLSGDDTLLGGGGKDIMAGGKGLDVLTGGVGRDVFVLEEGNGADTFVDFRDARDQLALLGGSQFGDLTITQEGVNTLISLDGDRLAQLNGVQANQITRADFTTVNLS